MHDIANLSFVYIAAHLTFTSFLMTVRNSKRRNKNVFNNHIVFGVIGTLNLDYMAHVTSGKIARCDWLLMWQDFSVMTAAIIKIVNAL